jgi:hypothetical protein
VPHLRPIDAQEWDKKRGQAVTDSFSECCMDAIPKKKCCQMSKISLFSPLIAPCGAGANVFAL